MTLDQAAMAAPMRITGFTSLTESARHKLSSLGLREETVITKILHTPLRDPIECLVGPQLLTVDRWLLKHIQVAPERP